MPHLRLGSLTGFKDTPPSRKGRRGFFRAPPTQEGLTCFRVDGLALATLPACASETLLDRIEGRRAPGRCETRGCPRGSGNELSQDPIGQALTNKKFVSGAQPPHRN